MNLIDRAAADFAKITGNNKEFGITATFTTPVDFPVQQSVVAVGLAFKHFLKVKDENEIVNTRQITFQVAEDNLTTFVTDASGNILVDASGNRIVAPWTYPVRNKFNEVNLLNHIVTWSDHFGEWSYVVAEQWPDDGLGVIMLKLSNYTAV
jgi:hypothetical protein